MPSTKLQRPWTVAPHGPVEKLEDNLWIVEGAVPGLPMPLKRRMALVRLDDGRVLVHNAMAVDEATVRDIEAWGEPAVLIVPNAWHRIDAWAFKQRYPAMKVYCPRGSRRGVEQAVPVDGDLDAAPNGDSVRLVHLAGIGDKEGVLIVKSGLYRERTTLVFTDAVFNQPHLPGVAGFVYRLIGSSGGPRVTPLMRLWAVRDKAALGEHLLRLAELPGLARVIMAHGHVITDAPEQVLAQVARQLHQR